MVYELYIHSGSEEWHLEELSGSFKSVSCFAMLSVFPEGIAAIISKKCPWKPGRRAPWYPPLSVSIPGAKCPV